MYTEAELKVHTAGFSSRLDCLFDTLGIREHGRAALLADWTGMSNSGAAKMYREDRLPRSGEAIEKLAQGFVRTALKSGKFTEINLKTVEGYLIHGGGNPLLESTNQIPEPKSSKKERKYFSKLSVPVQAQVYMLLDEAGKKKGVDLLSELSNVQLENLIEKIAEIHLEQRIEIKSLQMYQLLGALIKLVQSNVSL